MRVPLTCPACNAIVYCDYDDACRRVPKDSFYFYRDVIAGSESV